MLEIESAHLHPMMAAEGGTAIGWLIVAIFVVVGKWGWIIALTLLAMVWPLRKSKSFFAALIVALALPVALILLTISVINCLMPDRRKEMPPVEVRSAQAFLAP